MRKEEEKARRELIKEQYLRRKQQELMEEQGLGSPTKPKTAKTKLKKPSHQTHRPKSAFSREEISSDTFSSKGSSSTRKKHLSSPGVSNWCPRGPRFCRLLLHYCTNRSDPAGLEENTC